LDEPKALETCGGWFAGKNAGLWREQGSVLTLDAEVLQTWWLPAYKAHGHILKHSAMHVIKQAGIENVRQYSRSALRAHICV
jgi:hypothetical protein